MTVGAEKGCYEAEGRLLNESPFSSLPILDETPLQFETINEIPR